MVGNHIIKQDNIKANVHKLNLCKKNSLVTGTEGPRGFQKVKVPRFRDDGKDGVRLSALRTGRLFPQDIILVLGG